MSADIPPTELPPTTKPCPYCAETIQAAAIVCRYCGRDLPSEAPAPIVASNASVSVEVRKEKRENSRTAGLLLLACIGLCGVMWWAGLLPDGSARTSAPAMPPAPTVPRGPTDSEAYVMCKQFVEGRLKAPSTAQWPFSSRSDGVAVAKLQGKQFRVQGWVDSQNGFGAQIRTHYSCMITNTSGDNWHLDNLETD